MTVKGHGELSEVPTRIFSCDKALVFDWSTWGTATTAFLARIDGKWFVVQYFKEGAKAGQLATAFVPNQGQLRAFFRILFQ